MVASNDYKSAMEVADGLYAVELSTGGWSVADGPGTVLCDPDERELAGWHVPVRFESQEAASAAILAAPHAMFDIAPDSGWTHHCIASGGVLLPEIAGA
jgi:hypothetical protein